MRRAAMAVALALASAQAVAAVRQAAGPILYPVDKDRSIAWTWYDPAAPVRLCLKPGRHVTVEFSARERITDKTIGFDKAWQFVDRGNRFVLKQQAADPKTALTVWTELPGGAERRYFFDLAVCRPLRMLTFRYRDEPAVAVAAGVGATPAPAPIVRPVNDRYSGQAGSPEAESLRPVRAWNDGTFTYLTFAAGAQLPVVYRLQAGELAMVARHVQHERDTEGVPVRSTVVVHAVADRLVLKAGGGADRAFCVFNEDLMR